MAEQNEISTITTGADEDNTAISLTNLKTYNEQIKNWVTDTAKAKSAASADIATKLGTDAGSATQPVYFSGGKPVATTYTLGKDVPSNAVFTDANVTQGKSTTANWRPILSHNGYHATYGTDPGSATGSVYYAPSIAIQPSSGTIRATTFEGNLSGNAATATKATEDGKGNNIVNTYATKTSLNNYATIDWVDQNALSGYADEDGYFETDQYDEICFDANSLSMVNGDTIATREWVTGKGYLTSDIAITKGTGTSAVKLNSSSEASGDYALAEGYSTKATNASAHAEGYGSIAGISDKEPDYTKHGDGADVLEGQFTHAEGNGTWAKGVGAHSEGYRTKATSQYSHAEGYETSANGRYSHTEGRETKTVSDALCAHAEGYKTGVSGKYGHAEGYSTKAIGKASHAAGYCTEARGEAQTVIGKYNADNDSALFIVGNGQNETDDGRKNAFTVQQDGTATVGKNPVNDMDVATKSYVDDNGVDYLGTVSATSGLSTTAKAGDFYRVSRTFTFVSEVVHAGDILIAVKANPTQDASGWDVIHTEANTTYDENDFLAVAVSGDTAEIYSYDSGVNFKTGLQVNGDAVATQKWVKSEYLPKSGATTTGEFSLTTTGGITLKAGSEGGEDIILSCNAVWIGSGVAATEGWVTNTAKAKSAGTADSATYDGKGNNIADTYQPKGNYLELEEEDDGGKVTWQSSGFATINFDDVTLQYGGNEVATVDQILTYSLSKSGSKIILTDSNGKKTSVEDDSSSYDDSEIVSKIKTLEDEVELIKEQISCFRGDTQILMADGTTKNIQDVQYGDMIKSYDIENNCLVDVKSYGSYCTGFEQFWNIAGFTNGSVLYIGSDGHYLYRPATQQLIMSENFPIRGKVIASDGTQPKLVGRDKYNAFKTEKRYELISENGLYFANNILVGHAATTTFHHYLGGKLPLNEEEILAIEEDIQQYNDSALGGLNNPEFLRESGELMMVINKREEKINEHKKRLTDMDYKQVKWNQGKISEVEYKQYLSECEGCRAYINNAEEKLVNERKELEEVRKKHGLTKKTRKEQFLATHHNQMERIRKRNKI